MGEERNETDQEKTGDHVSVMCPILSVYACVPKFFFAPVATVSGLFIS